MRESFFVTRTNIRLRYVYLLNDQVWNASAFSSLLLDSTMRLFVVCPGDCLDIRICFMLAHSSISAYFFIFAALVDFSFNID